jgi:hypothetical protein
VTGILLRLDFLFSGLLLQDRKRVVFRESIYFHDIALYIIFGVSFLVGSLLIFL